MKVIEYLTGRKEAGGCYFFKRSRLYNDFIYIYKLQTSIQIYAAYYHFFTGADPNHCMHTGTAKKFHGL